MRSSTLRSCLCCLSIVGCYGAASESAVLPCEPGTGEHCDVAFTVSVARANEAGWGHLPELPMDHTIEVDGRAEYDQMLIAGPGDVAFQGARLPSTIPAGAVLRGLTFWPAGGLATTGQSGARGEPVLLDRELVGVVGARLVVNNIVLDGNRVVLDEYWEILSTVAE